MLHTARSKASKLSFDKHLGASSPLFRRESEESPEGKILNRIDTSSCIVFEDDYKAIKLENNLEHLNKDIELVNDEIEQIKKLLFF